MCASKEYPKFGAGSDGTHGIRTVNALAFTLRAVAALFARVSGRDIAALGRAYSPDPPHTAGGLAIHLVVETVTRLDLPGEVHRGVTGHRW